MTNDKDQEAIVTEDVTTAEEVAPEEDSTETVDIDSTDTEEVATDEAPEEDTESEDVTPEKEEKPKKASSEEKTLPRMKVKYREDVVPALQEQFNFGNVNQVPTLTKIVVNMGVGDAAKDSKQIDNAVKDLTAITGQKPSVTKARKSIAQFKLREGMPIGTHVTLRGDRMWEFFDRLVTLALPRIRDFRGLSPKQFDGNGNYTFGLTEQVVFLEIDPDQVDRQRGMDITLVTTAKDNEEGKALLKQFGFPFTEK